MMHEHPTHVPPLASEKIAIERKLFFLDLKENHRGRFLKITEDVAGRRNTVMIPAQAFPDLAGALLKLIEFERGLPPAPAAPPRE
jgi:PurA ssDNA and RNA-binding protein